MWHPTSPKLSKVSQKGLLHWSRPLRHTCHNMGRKCKQQRPQTSIHLTKKKWTLGPQIPLSPSCVSYSAQSMPWQNTQLKQPKNGRVYSGSQFQGTGHPVREGLKDRLWGRQSSHCICSQDAQRDECLHSPFFPRIHSRSLVHGTVPPTIKHDFAW